MLVFLNLWAIYDLVVGFVLSFSLILFLSGVISLVHFLYTSVATLFLLGTVFFFSFLFSYHRNRNKILTIRKNFLAIMSDTGSFRAMAQSQNPCSC